MTSSSAAVGKRVERLREPVGLREVEVDRRIRGRGAARLGAREGRVAQVVGRAQRLRRADPRRDLREAARPRRRGRDGARGPPRSPRPRRARTRRARTRRAAPRPRHRRTSVRSPIPLLLLRARRRSCAARAAAATSPCPRGCRAPRRPRGRCARRSRRGRRPARCSSGSTSSAARTRSAVTSAAASSPTSGTDGRERGVAFVAATARLLPAHVVDGTAVGERAQPGAQRPTVGIERLRSLPDPHEHVLAHVLGGAGIADDPQRQPVDERRELVVDLAERRLRRRRRAVRGRPRSQASWRAGADAPRDGRERSVVTSIAPTIRHRHRRPDHPSQRASQARPHPDAGGSGTSTMPAPTTEYTSEAGPDLGTPPVGQVGRPPDAAATTQTGQTSRMVSPASRVTSASMPADRGADGRRTAGTPRRTSLRRWRRRDRPGTASTPATRDRRRPRCPAA